MKAGSRGDKRAQVEACAREVLGEAAADWLQSWNRALGCTPAEMLASEEGAEQVLRILGRIEHGVVS